MNEERLRRVLEGLAGGRLDLEEALDYFKDLPFEDLGYAKLDHHRGLRQGVPEVIYGEGKSPDQVIGIVQALVDRGQDLVLITRLDEDLGRVLEEDFGASYNKDARLALVGDLPEPTGRGRVVVASGGTSDMPVAEEAALTAQALGNEVTRLYDVGVAGIHRLLAHREDLESARVVIAVAGMEGALASVVGGLVSCPVIAVPTSVGYGASFGGLAALLAMLNSCASGVSVVNIDNGFGAGYIADRINKG